MVRWQRTPRRLTDRLNPACLIASPVAARLHAAIGVPGAGWLSSGEDSVEEDSERGDRLAAVLDWKSEKHDRAGT
jgi:hypothetical protein